MIWPFKKPAPYDYVLLVKRNGDRPMKRVEWLADTPYARTHDMLEETRCRLLPGGKLVGQCFVSGWEPASSRMRAYFDGQTTDIQESTK